MSLPPPVPGGVRRVPHRGPGALPRQRRDTGRVSAGPPRPGQRGAGVNEQPVTVEPAEQTTPVIEVRNLEVNFAGRVGLLAGLLGRKGADAKAVDGVDLTVREGEVLALAGESGCGKTTLARAVMGLIRPQRGQI